MKTGQPVFAISVLAAAVMAAYSPARAADTSEVDEFVKPSSMLSIGWGNWDRERSKKGNYDGMRDNGSYLLLDADIRMRDDAEGIWKLLSVRDFGTDNRELRAEYLRQGAYGAAIDYTQFRSRDPYTLNTNQVGIGSSAQTTGANILNTAIGSGANHQFGTDRKKLGLSLYKNVMPNLDLNVKFSSEDKEGNKLGTNGSALFIADYINWTTHKAEITLDYTGKDFQLSGGYLGSWFRNNNDAGLVSLNAGAQLRTQPLDNSAHQLFASGSYGFTPTTKANFKLAYTHGIQDANLPTANIVSAALTAIPSLQGEVNTTLLQIGLTSRPLPQLSLSANLRYHDVDDKTPQYGAVNRTDGGGTLNVNSTPYSYTTQSGKFEGTYSFAGGYSLNGGVDYRSQDRTIYTDIFGAAYNAYVPMRQKVDETTYRLQVRKGLSDTINGSLGYLAANRKGSAFTTSTQVGTAFVSPVNTADRDRQQVRLGVDWSPIDALGLQFNYETSDDDYGSSDRSHGLSKGDAELYSLDVSYQISDNWQVTGRYTRNINNANFNNFGTALVTRVRKQNDTGDAAGVGIVGQVGSKTKLGADLTWSKDKTTFDQSNSDGSATGVVAPEIVAKSLRLKLYAIHAWEKNADLRFEVIHERWQTDDWQYTYTSGLPWQFGTATDGTTILTVPKQNATFLGFRYIYKFQ